MRPIVEKWLCDNGFGVAHEILISGYCDLAGFRFARRTSHRIPELLTVVTVELKVNDIRGVMTQAKSNQYFVRSSYAAMPLDKCKRMRSKTISRFRKMGIGLLGVDDEVNVIVEPQCDSNKDIKWMTRKLWRWQKHKNWKKPKPLD